jgi:hypothetical protein
MRKRHQCPPPQISAAADRRRAPLAVIRTNSSSKAGIEERLPLSKGSDTKAFEALQ